MRYVLNLSYCGSAFCGWQVQPDAPSVQGTLEKALGTLLGEVVSVTGAGRTDTGVNAIGYVAHFDSAKEFEPAQLCYKLNAILPPEIAVKSVCPADGEFHSRFDATKREYTYFLHRVKDPFVSGYSYLYGYPNLDFEKMNEAAKLLLGTNDFSCFEKTGGDNKTSICTITEAHWEHYSPTVCCGNAENDYWYFRISADRFLRNMVRAIVGTLLEVGRGKRTVESVKDVLKSGDRCQAGESVPGHALFLTRVEY